MIAKFAIHWWSNDIGGHGVQSTIILLKGLVNVSVVIIIICTFHKL